MNLNARSDSLLTCVSVCNRKDVFLQCSKCGLFAGRKKLDVSKFRVNSWILALVAVTHCHSLRGKPLGNNWDKTGKASLSASPSSSRCPAAICDVALPESLPTSRGYISFAGKPAHVSTGTPVTDIQCDSLALALRFMLVVRGTAMRLLESKQSLLRRRQPVAMQRIVPRRPS